MADDAMTDESSGAHSRLLVQLRPDRGVVTLVGRHQAADFILG